MTTCIWPVGSHVATIALHRGPSARFVRDGVETGWDAEKTMTKRACGLGMAAIAVLLLGGGASTVRLKAQAPAAQSAATPERTVWYYYKVKWGFQEEFVDLFRRNHLTVLKEEIKAGRMKSVRTFVPTYHGDGRADWTFAVEIVFRDAAAMTAPSDEGTIQKRLFPDRAKFLKEEQRRFEIVDAHWDVPLNQLDLDHP